jgi:hypothetical protein
MSHFPKWVQALEKAPKFNVIVGSITTGLLLAGIVTTIHSASGDVKFSLFLS